MHPLEAEHRGIRTTVALSLINWCHIIIAQYSQSTSSLCQDRRPKGGESQTLPESFLMSKEPKGTTRYSKAPRGHALSRAGVPECPAGRCPMYALDSSTVTPAEIGQSPCGVRPQWCSAVENARPGRQRGVKGGQSQKGTYTSFSAWHPPGQWQQGWQGSLVAWHV